MGDLVKRLRAWSEHETTWDLLWEAADRIEAQDKRNKELEAALREKDNIAYIIDGHGITHESFTIVYRGEQ
jgi:hypothetical protein